MVIFILSLPGHRPLLEGNKSPSFDLSPPHGRSPLSQLKPSVLYHERVRDCRTLRLRDGSLQTRIHAEIYIALGQSSNPVYPIGGSTSLVREKPCMPQKGITFQGYLQRNNGHSWRVPKLMRAGIHWRNLSNSTR